MWPEERLPQPWKPPACLHWKTRDFATLIAVSGRFRGATGYRGLLRRLTTTSAISRIRYWSFSRKRWRRLFSEVSALDGPDPSRRRADFSVDEIRPARNYFVWQKENSLASGVVVRIRPLQVSKDRMVLQQINISPSYFVFVKILGAGEFETVIFLDREKDDVWRFYSLSRVGSEEHVPDKAELASLINRLVAGFRYLGGIPADREPPAAP